METTTNPSRSLDDEKADAEIARLESEIDVLTNEWNQTRDTRTIDDSEKIIHKIDRYRKRIEAMHTCKQNRFHDRFMKKFKSSIPEEYLIDQNDLELWITCERLRDFSEVYSKKEIIETVRQWISRNENWTNELMADVRREAMENVVNS